MSNGRTTVVQFGSNYILELTDKPGVLFWTCPLAIDADGHPQCYHPKGSPPGLDYLANAGRPGNWWGIATDPKGTPYVQGASDPAPGFYVSTTALVDSKCKSNDPSRYIHSGEFPFVVLPSKPKFDPKQKLGDVLMCFNNDTGLWSWAFYADIGPANAIGEGSMKLASALGLSDSPKRGGTKKEAIAMVYWPGSSLGWPVRPPLDPAGEALRLFNEWGGIASCQAGLPQFNWTQFEMPPRA